ncbi:MAG: glycosyltransferase family 2 protein [Candidatus Bathyarchaeia archaeon]
MKVSIVIPTYYRPKDLADLFDSLLRQTVKPMEVIVVDDTPTNVIEKVCETYHDSFKRFDIKLVYVRNYRERSAAIARNIGARMANGEIMLFLDSDVVLLPDYIEKILEVFDEKPETLGVQGWINLGIESKGHIYTKRHIIVNIWRMIFHLSYIRHSETKKFKLFQYPSNLQKITLCESLSGSNMALKRSVFDEFKFDENLLKYSYMEDKLFTYSVYKKYPNSLYITPYAKCVHKVSEEGRITTSTFEHPHLRACRKYVLKKLFGTKGIIIFGWQTLGLLTLSISRKIWRFIRKK